MEKRGGKIDRQFPLRILYVNRHVKCLWVRARCCCSCHRASLQHKAIRIYSSTESTDTRNRDNDDDGNATNNSFQLWLHIAPKQCWPEGLSLAGMLSTYPKAQAPWHGHLPAQATWAPPSFPSTWWLPSHHIFIFPEASPSCYFIFLWFLCHLKLCHEAT